MSAVALAMIVALGGGSATADAATDSPSASTLPPIHHVFVIVLQNENYVSTFGAGGFGYVKSLPAQGALLSNYYGTAHDAAAADVGLVSGQPPNIQNELDCPIYDNFIFPTMLSDGVESGSGCVYPAGVANIGTQLSAAGLTWKAYEEDMGNVATREAAVCAHPTLNRFDPTQYAVTGDGYVPRHDPFVYFHSVIDNAAYCDAHVVALGSSTGALPADAVAGETGLATDLQQVSTTPNFSMITPNLCDGGHDFPCTNQTSGLSRLGDINSFLQTWVPLITSSPAFKQDGLLEITVDEARTDTSACCGEMPGPNSSMPGIFGPGGGRVGTVLISPDITPGTVTATPYNHYSSLATWEQLFGLSPLAEAATAPTFGADVFTAGTG